MDAVVKLRSIVYNLLNFQEFPRLIDLKRRAFAAGLTSYAKSRRVVIEKENALLDSIQGHYLAYLED